MIPTLADNDRMILKKKPQLINVFKSYNKRMELERKAMINSYLFILLMTIIAGGLLILIK